MSFKFKNYEKNIYLIEDFLKYILQNIDDNYSPITTTDTETKIEDKFDEFISDKYPTDKLHEDGLDIDPVGNSGLTDGSYDDLVFTEGSNAKIKIEVNDGVAKILKVLDHGSGYTKDKDLYISKRNLGIENDNKLTIKVNDVFSLFDIFSKNVDATNADTLKKNIINFIKKSRNLKYKIIKNIAYKNTIKTHISAKHYFNNIIKGVDNNDKISYYIDFNKDYDLLNNIIQHYRLISEAYFGEISIKLFNESGKSISSIDEDVPIDIKTKNKKYGSINLTIKASNTEIPHNNEITITKIDTSNLNGLVEILNEMSSPSTDNNNYEYDDIFSDIDNIPKEFSKNIKLNDEDSTPAGTAVTSDEQDEDSTPAGTAVTSDEQDEDSKNIKFKLKLITTKDNNFFKKGNKQYEIFLEMLEIKDGTHNDVINHIKIKNNVNNLENAMNELKYNNKQKEFLNKYLAVYLGPIIFEKYNLIDIVVFCIIILISVLLYFLRTYMSVYISGILLLVVVLIMTFLTIIFN